MQGAIITGGNKIISYQVVRIEQFTKGSLGKIGGETERTSKHHRNEDIDGERTPLNLYFKKSEGGLTAQWYSGSNFDRPDFKRMMDERQKVIRASIWEHSRPSVTLNLRKIRING